MVLKEAVVEGLPAATAKRTSRTVCVVWIDWYAYHVARFRALCEAPALRGRISGVEMVGGTGVHRGLKFREPLPTDLSVTTLFESGNWNELSKWKIALAVWRHLSKTQPDTVLVPGYYNVPALATALWARLHGRRSVLMTESTEADHPRRSSTERIKGLLIRTLFSWCIAGGSPHRRYLKKLGFPEARIAGKYDVIDNRFFREQANRDRLRHNASDFRLPQHYFLFVGRLAEEKNVVGLLESYCAYRKSGGTWALVLVGDGPLRDTLRTMAKQSGCEQDIYFEGLKTSGELSPYYAFAGCFVLPSSREPWGLVVNEAMASGLPVVITRECGCAEDLVSDGKNGFVFRAKDLASLTGFLHRMEAMGAVERRAMGLASLERIHQFSPESWAVEVARIAYA